MRFVEEQEKKKSESEAGRDAERTRSPSSVLPSLLSLEQRRPPHRCPWGREFAFFFSEPLSPDSFSHWASFLKCVPSFSDGSFQLDCLSSFAELVLFPLSPRFFLSLAFSSTFISFRSSRAPRARARFLRNRHNSAEHLPVPVACETFLAASLASFLPSPSPSRSARYQRYGGRASGEMFPLPQTSRGRFPFASSPADTSPLRHLFLFHLSASFLSCFL